MNTTEMVGLEESSQLFIEMHETTEMLQTESYTHVDISVRETTLSVLYICIGIIGLLGNAMVVTILIKVASDRIDVTNMFIISQSIIDLLTAAILILTTVVKHDGRRLEGVADDIFCRIWLGKAPLWSFIFSSVYNLVGVTFERYLKIVHPIFHKMSFTPRVAMVMIGLIWLIGPLFNIPYAVFPSGLSNGECILLYYWPSKVVQQVTGMIHITLQYFLPIIALAYCYGRMAWVLHAKIKQVAPSGGGDQKNGRNASLVTGRKSVIKTLAIVSAGFILCSSWNQWFFVFFNLNVIGYQAFTTTYYHFSVVALFSNCCINPFIYALKYKPVKEGLKKYLCCKKVEVDLSETSSGSVRK